VEDHLTDLCHRPEPPTQAEENQQLKKRRRISRRPQALSVKLTVVCDRNATVASAEIGQYINGKFVVECATGSAKREPDDVRDDALATYLAVGRALVNLGGSLQGTARILVADASARQEHESLRRVRNRLRRMRVLRRPVRLALADIAAEHGFDAADRAADRRGDPRLERPEPVDVEPERAEP
jgi:hypothetical protein